MLLSSGFNQVLIRVEFEAVSLEVVCVMSDSSVASFGGYSALKERHVPDGVQKYRMIHREFPISQSDRISDRPNSFQGKTAKGVPAREKQNWEAQNAPHADPMFTFCLLRTGPMRTCKGETGRDFLADMWLLLSIALRRVDVSVKQRENNSPCIFTPQA